MKQSQLESQVLEKTDYSKYAPSSKVMPDPNQPEDHEPVPKRSPKKKVLAKELAYANGNWTNTDTKGQIIKDYSNYNSKNMVQQQLTSALDKQVDSNGAWVQPEDEYRVKHSSFVPAKNMGASIKQKNLASTLTGHDALKYYGSTPQNQDQNIVDIDLRGLPSDCTEKHVRQLSMAKHVISAEVDEDAIRGICRGTGRIKVRLNQGETLEQIQSNFERAGFKADAHYEDPRKRPIVTQEPRNDPSRIHPLDPKDRKVHEMATKFENVL